MMLTKEAVTRCSSGCWLYKVGYDKTGTPYQATVSSKLFQKMSNFVKEIEKNRLYFIIHQSLNQCNLNYYK
jgi:hypothetical protein